MLPICAGIYQEENANYSWFLSVLGNLEQQLAERPWLSSLVCVFTPARWQFCHTYLLIVRVTAKMSLIEIDFPQYCLTQDSHHIVYFYYMNHIFAMNLHHNYINPQTPHLSGGKCKIWLIFVGSRLACNNTWLKGNDWAITTLQHVLTNLKSHCKNVIFRDRFSSILPYYTQDAPNHIVYFFLL